MFEIKTVLEINASRQSIWDVLIDFDAYSQWNPFIIYAARTRNQLDITTKPCDEKEMNFTPQLTVEKYNDELKWVGKVGSEIILRAEHSFKLQEIRPGKTKFIHEEVFSGGLTCVIGHEKRLNIQRGFELMNNALSERVASLSQVACKHYS